MGRTCFAIVASLAAGGAILSIDLLALSVSTSAETPPRAAIIDFSYEDTSGEPHDQAADHARRLRSFNDDLRSDLAAAGAYDIVSLPCGETCPSPQTDIRGLLAAAHEAGAERLIIGAIQKMSTLVQNAKVVVLDVQDETPRYERLLSFRGDNDEAWRRAEQFLARELARQEKAEEGRQRQRFERSAGRRDGE
jgi:hypothetical protein